MRRYLVCLILFSFLSGSPRLYKEPDLHKKNILSPYDLVSMKVIFPRMEKLMEGSHNQIEHKINILKTNLSNEEPTVSTKLASTVLHSFLLLIQEKNYINFLSLDELEHLKQLCLSLYSVQLKVKNTTRSPRPQTASLVIIPSILQQIEAGAQYAIASQTIVQTSVTQVVGGVKGPFFATNDALARYNNDGDHIQNSSVILDDNSNITGVNRIEVQDIDVLSDQSVKTNVNSIPTNESFEKILALTPVTFKYIGEYGCNDKEERGFIAQKVQKVLPELVERSRKGLLTVSYHKLVVDLVGAIQALQKEVEVLKNK